MNIITAVLVLALTGFPVEKTADTNSVPVDDVPIASKEIQTYDSFALFDSGAIVPRDEVQGLGSNRFVTLKLDNTELSLEKGLEFFGGIKLNSGEQKEVLQVIPSEKLTFDWNFDVLSGTRKVTFVPVGDNGFTVHIADSWPAPLIGIALTFLLFLGLYVCIISTCNVVMEIHGFDEKYIIRYPGTYPTFPEKMHYGISFILHLMVGAIAISVVGFNSPVFFYALMASLLFMALTLVSKLVTKGEYVRSE